MISTKTVDWKIFQVGDDFLVAINFIYLVILKTKHNSGSLDNKEVKRYCDFIETRLKPFKTRLHGKQLL